MDRKSKGVNLSADGQKMNLLGKGLQVDLLPPRAAVIDVLVSEKIGVVWAACGEVTESVLLSQTGQPVNQQDAINFKRRVEGH